MKISAVPGAILAALVALLAIPLGAAALLAAIVTILIVLSVLQLSRFLRISIRAPSGPAPGAVIEGEFRVVERTSRESVLL